MTLAQYCIARVYKQILTKPLVTEEEAKMFRILETSVKLYNKAKL